MTKEVLNRAVMLQTKINNLESYLNYYAVPKASMKFIKLLFGKEKSLVAGNFCSKKEYLLDMEEYDIVNEALAKQLEKYKEEFEALSV